MAIGLSIAAAVVCAEVWFRATSSPTFPFYGILDPYVGFRQPGDYTWRSDGPSKSSRTHQRAVAYNNEDGLRLPSRDYVLRKAKPPGELRVAVLGGSTVHTGTTYDVSLPGALKRKLCARYPDQPFEVINAGIIGAIARQELVWLVTTIVNYNVDLVLVYDGVNDTGQMIYYEGRPGYPYHFHALEKAWAQLRGGYRDPLWRLLLARSAIATRLWPRTFGVGSLFDPADPQRLIAEPHERAHYAIAHIDDWRKICAVCAGFHIRPAFCLQPCSLYGIMTSTRALHTTAPELVANYYMYEDFRKSVRAFAAANDTLTVVDLSDSFSDPSLYWDGAHVYDDVNDAIADQLVSALQSDIEFLRRRR